MNIWKMCVAMAQRSVIVLVRVRFRTVPVARVRMLMMLVMRVGVRVRHWLMHVLMLVVFGDMQQNAH